MFKLILFLLLLAKPPEFKIGVHAPLSGPVASYGTYCLEGIKLAFLNHPEIELVIEDNEGKIENTAVILRDLVDHGVAAVIGPIISPNALLAGLEAAKLGVPIILPSVTNTAITKVSRYLFRGCFTDEHQGEIIANFSYSFLGAQEVYIIADTSNIYSAGLALYFKGEFEKLGGKAPLIEWDGKSDISETIETLSGTTLFLPLYYEAVKSIVKTARKKNLDITFVGADGWDVPELFKALAEDTNALYFSTHYFASPATQAFSDLYRKKYGKEPNAFSALGFDAGNLLLLAIQKAKGPRPVDIYEALCSIYSFEGVTGTFFFDGKRDPVKDVFIVRLQRGKTSLLKKL